MFPEPSQGRPMEDQMADSPGSSVEAADRRPSEEDRRVEVLGEVGRGGVQGAEGPGVVLEVGRGGVVLEVGQGGVQGAEGPGVVVEVGQGGVQDAEGPGVVVEVTWSDSEEDDGPPGEEEWNGFISGAAAAGPGEEDSMHPGWKPGDPVTPQHVLWLQGYTKDYLCSPADNVYNINFSRFKIRELQSGAVILDIKKHCPTEIQDVLQIDPGRFIQYHFSPAFLTLKEIGATLEFTVGSRAVNRFRLIERHFFRDLLLKTFDFEIGFCIPFSRNTCEHIYSLPDLDPSTMEEMVASPFQTRSDSFYFANNQLIMHHKAEYSFNHLGPGQSLSQ